LLTIVVAGLIWAIRYCPADARLGAAWFAITLAPSLSLRYLNPGYFAHDRSLYLRSVGLGLMAAVWLSRVKFNLPRVIAASALVLVLYAGIRSNDVGFAPSAIYGKGTDACYRYCPGAVD